MGNERTEGKKDEEGEEEMTVKIAGGTLPSLS